MSNQKEIVELTHQVRKFAMGKISDISDINRETTFLTASASAAAAKIEANSPGPVRKAIFGRTFWERQPSSVSRR
jgi:hypothetical protein